MNVVPTRARVCVPSQGFHSATTEGFKSICDEGGRLLSDVEEYGCERVSLPLAGATRVDAGGGEKSLGDDAWTTGARVALEASGWYGDCPYGERDVEVDVARDDCLSDSVEGSACRGGECSFPCEAAR